MKHCPGFSADDKLLTNATQHHNGQITDFYKKKKKTLNQHNTTKLYFKVDGVCVREIERERH